MSKYPAIPFDSLPAPNVHAALNGYFDIGAGQRYHVGPAFNSYTRCSRHRPALQLELFHPPQDELHG